VETIGGVASTTAYGYDQVGRLTDVTVDSTLTAHYEYDGNGNRLAVTRPGGGTVSGTYDAQDRLTAYGAVTYTYTANGDLQTATSGGEITTYGYDVFGNLTTVALPSGSTIEYVVDGQNRRIGKKVDGVLTQVFLYGSQLRPVAELDGAGNVVTRFVYGSRINVPDYMVRGGATYRLLTDSLGSVRLVVDTATGTIAERLDYDEFGQIIQDTTPGFQPFGFAGGLYDSDSKLTRFGARDYDPFTGRWTTKDPIGFAGRDTNVFGYVLNDPQNLADPEGLLFGGWINAGESYGESALQYWADRSTDPDNTWYDTAAYNFMGALAALWTPCTSDETALTLLGGPGTKFFKGWRWMKSARGFEKTWSRNFRTGWHRLPPGNYPGAGRNLPHYHRRPGIGKHRPWEGGF
jgi:RHS repeat-associated protein